jgi:hypothetical protein
MSTQLMLPSYRNTANEPSYGNAAIATKLSQDSYRKAIIAIMELQLNY